jgi:uncharacterized protein
MKRSIVVYALLCLCFSRIYAQESSNDWTLIEKQNFHKEEFGKRKVKFLFVGKNPVIKYNPVSLSLGALMYVYQKAISPQFSSRCGYEISCSNFSKQVIQEYGLLKGVALTADRLTRCTPFAAIDLNTVFLNEENKVIDNPGKYKLHP